MSENADINKLIKYSSDLSQLNILIHSIQNSIYSDNFFWPSDIEESVLLKKFLSDRGINTDSPSEVSTALESLREEISNLEKLRIKVVSREFSVEFWDRIFYWLRDKLVKKPFILDRKYDGGILGGAIITWRGSYFDLSLNSKLNKFFEEDKAHVFE